MSSRTGALPEPIVLTIPVLTAAGILSAAWALLLVIAMYYGLRPEDFFSHLLVGGAPAAGAAFGVGVALALFRGFWMRMIFGPAISVLSIVAWMTLSILIRTGDLKIGAHLNPKDVGPLLYFSALLTLAHSAWLSGNIGPRLASVIYAGVGCLVIIPIAAKLLPSSYLWGIYVILAGSGAGLIQMAALGLCFKQPEDRQETGRHAIGGNEPRNPARVEGAGVLLRPG